MPIKPTCSKDHKDKQMIQMCFHPPPCLPQGGGGNTTNQGMIPLVKPSYQGCRKVFSPVQLWVQSSTHRCLLSINSPAYHEMSRFANCESKSASQELPNKTQNMKGLMHQSRFGDNLTPFCDLLRRKSPKKFFANLLTRMLVIEKCRSCNYCW